MAEDNDQMEEKLLQSMMRGEDGAGDKSSAIAIAKSRGWLRQDGESLTLTEQGKRVAENA